MLDSATSRRAAGRSISPTGSSASPRWHPTQPMPSSSISGPQRTRSFRGHRIGCRSLVAPIPATDATSAPQNRSPPAHDYKRATAQCSTMPSTPRQCGCEYPTDLESRIAARLSANGRSHPRGRPSLNALIGQAAKSNEEDRASRDRREDRDSKSPEVTPRCAPVRRAATMARWTRW